MDQLHGVCQVRSQYDLTSAPLSGKRIVALCRRAFIAEAYLVLPSLTAFAEVEQWDAPVSDKAWWRCWCTLIRSALPSWAATDFPCHASHSLSSKLQPVSVPTRLEHPLPQLHPHSKTHPGGGLACSVTSGPQLGAILTKLEQEAEQRWSRQRLADSPGK